MAQKKLRGECIQLEDVLAQLRKEYEMLRIEFEQNLAANEQTGPINREMRHLITSLQNHNNQLKGEVQRYKRKYKESSTEIPRVCSTNWFIWFLSIHNNDFSLILCSIVEKGDSRAHSQIGTADGTRK